MIQANASRYLGRALTLAAVLTGPGDRTESIVETAIDSLPTNTFSEEALLAEVAAAAWKGSQAAEEGVDQYQLSHKTSLPEELQAVFELPRQLRYCFSIRVLAGMSAQVCGRLIGLRPYQVNYLVDLSIQILARAARRKELRMSLVDSLTLRKRNTYDEAIR
jgi:hypothetical protein